MGAPTDSPTRRGLSGEGLSLKLRQKLMIIGDFIVRKIDVEANQSGATSMGKLAPNCSICNLAFPGE